jgi:hypothetical protein
MCGGDVRIGWRQRAARFFRYHDITLRLSRPSGTRAEVQKLADGCADYIFVGFGDDGQLGEWLLVSVSALRPLLRKKWLVKHMHDAAFICVPFWALDDAGAIVGCSNGVRDALRARA